MKGHHLIHGKLKHYITGLEIDDTDDERVRQRIAKFLVEKRYFIKNEIIVGRSLNISAGNEKAIIKIDFLVKLESRILMMIRFSPGSIITRHRPGLAASRLTAPYQIPVVVITNGREAEILDPFSGKVVQTGLDSIPYKKDLIQMTVGHDFSPISDKVKEMESRIIFAFEVDDACPCDTDICRL